MDQALTASQQSKAVAGGRELPRVRRRIPAPSRPSGDCTADCPGPVNGVIDKSPIGEHLAIDHVLHARKLMPHPARYCSRRSTVAVDLGALHPAAQIGSLTGVDRE